MKQLLVLIILPVIFLLGCIRQTNDKSDDSSVVLKPAIDSSTTKEWIFEDSIGCEFIYDTIIDKRYGMHLLILEKYKNKGKRGYIFSDKGDTINNFLYPKDIIEFIFLLNAKEKGKYKVLTNKVVFLLLEEEPKMLDHGLGRAAREENDLDYFMEHVSNPHCNTLSLDSIRNIIKTEMEEPNERAKQIKERLLMNLGKDNN